MKKTKTTKIKSTQIKLKLSELKNNPYHDGSYNKEQIKKLETSIHTLGILRSFSAFKKGEDYFLVCGHHTREAAIKVLGKDTVVEVTVQPYDDDTAVWGMAVENLTQDGDVKKKIKDLVNTRKYLKKTFKNYQEFDEFMKKKGIIIEKNGTAVGISYSSEIKYRDGTRKKGEQHYPQIGSSRQLSYWLNRQGIIINHIEINELLRIKDNLSPDLYEKMAIGDRKKKKENEDDEMSFTLSDAKMLSGLGNDHKEQKQVLKAMENSIGERMFRSRTRAKVITKYKEMKNAVKTGKIKVKAGKTSQEVDLDEEDKKKIKESIDMIRKGKKDIGNIELPNIKLPQNITEITIVEYTNDLINRFKTLGNEMELYSKEKLSQNSTQQLEDWLKYLQSWGNHKLAPFFKAVAKETAKKRQSTGNTEELVKFNFINDNDNDL